MWEKNPWSQALIACGFYLHFRTREKEHICKETACQELIVSFSFDDRYQKWCHFQYITYLFFIMSPDAFHGICICASLSLFFHSKWYICWADDSSLMTAPVGELLMLQLLLLVITSVSKCLFFCSHHTGRWFIVKVTKFVSFVTVYQFESIISQCQVSLSYQTNEQIYTKEHLLRTEQRKNGMRWNRTSIHTHTHTRT